MGAVCVRDFMWKVFGGGKQGCREHFVGVESVDCWIGFKSFFFSLCVGCICCGGGDEGYDLELYGMEGNALKSPSSFFFFLMNMMYYHCRDMMHGRIPLRLSTLS